MNVDPPMLSTLPYLLSPIVPRTRHGQALPPQDAPPKPNVTDPLEILTPQVPQDQAPPLLRERQPQDQGRTDREVTG